MDPSGKVAIVTGAGQGIGRAVALRLLQDGWKVMIAEVDEEAGAEAVAALESLPGEVGFFQTDVSRELDVRWLVRHTVDLWGRLDGLVNNAGFMIRKPVGELALSEWNEVLGTNLTGAFLCTRHAAPFLRESHGAVVNVASTRAYMSEPDTEAYAASKGGLVALTHALALSLGPDVRVNSVSPGWIEVSEWKKAALREDPELTVDDHVQHPVGRVGRPEDVAEAVRYLLSPEAGFVTGADLVIDGGMTRKMIYL